MIEWRFKPNSRDDMDIDPVQGEFFTTRDIDNISTAVVREGIQNALDERNRDSGENKCVKVRISLSGEKYAVKSEFLKPLINSLLPHLNAYSSGIQHMPDMNKSVPYLVFEDFNTTGLEGDPKESFVDNIKDKKPHNFYFFWRNVGRSGKTDDNLGRWGLGKTVFPAASQINTFWGVTVRKSDRKRLLMGQCILRMHNRTDSKKQEFGYKPYGMYGNYTGDNYFAEPVDSENEVSDFENLFRLQRKQHSGFSIVVPFVTSEIAIDHLAYSVIEQYFYPILEGKLEVQIEFEDLILVLDRNNIEKAIDAINFDKLTVSDDKKIRSRDSLHNLFSLAKWTFNIQEENIYTLKEPEPNSIPRWGKSLFVDKDKLEHFREKFENNERIAFRIPVKYHPYGAQPLVRWYQAVIEKDLSLKKPENLFVRDGITISGISSMDKGQARGIVIIQDIDLARMLGDSENPAHTEWQADSRNFKGKYVHGKEVLGFVKNTLKRLFENLLQPPVGLQKDLLLDFFSIPVEELDAIRKKEKPDKNKVGKDESVSCDLNEIKSKIRPYIIEKLHSGVKIIRNIRADDIPDSMRIRLGYDVPRGNPLTSYQDLDFDVSKFPVVIESQGVYFTKCEKNILEFNIEKKEKFQISLSGFDEKRDLFVKID